MSQVSVVNYFNTKKRPAIEELKIARAKKVLVLDSDVASDVFLKEKLNIVKPVLLKNVQKGNETTSSRKICTPSTKKTKNKKLKELPCDDIQKLFNNMVKKSQTNEETPKKTSQANTDVEFGKCVTPQTPTKKINAMDKVQVTGKELTLNQLKQKISRSGRLAELKASINRFKEADNRLKQAEKRTSKASEPPTIKTFKNIELEVNLSPQRIHSPEKAYLSPKKDNSVRKNLINLLSPTKNAAAIISASKEPLFPKTKVSLTLPYRYRALAETFRSIDTVCQIIHNRKEVITFRKLKPAVEELSKKNLTEKHLAQIKFIYPDAFKYQQQKIKVFGTGMRQEQWELVIIPNLPQDIMTADVLLERRRKLYNILIERLKDYHQEFLTTLNPPMEICRNKITRWHPEFDIERVPDIESALLPQAPTEITYSTGKEVLERARQLFNCNTRMEQALLKLKEAQKENNAVVEEKSKEVESVLKGIPRALLEKVRQKQAAKALMSMTCSADKEKEVQLYTRLPEIVRLIRNLFVAEKKSVLPLDNVVEKLGNCFRTYLTKIEIEYHLRVIAKEVPDWLVLHDIRHTVFVKISKNADISLVINKLEYKLEEKCKTS